MGLKFPFFSVFLVCFSCSTKKIRIVDLDIPPPPPPPSFSPTSSPPNFTPNISEIQINRIPSPLNVNGNLPYAVWVDGKRLPLNSVELKELAKSLNIKYEQPPNTAKIHSGEGWLYPFPTKNNQNIVNKEDFLKVFAPTK